MYLQDIGSRPPEPFESEIPANRRPVERRMNYSGVAGVGVLVEASSRGSASHVFHEYPVVPGRDLWRFTDAPPCPFNPDALGTGSRRRNSVQSISLLGE